MTRLDPKPVVSATCPKCGNGLEPIDWMVLGMHNMALVLCRPCNKEFYHTLPSGHSLFYPALLDSKTGCQYDPLPGYNWFHDLILRGFAARTNTSWAIRREVFRKAGERPLALLNTIDVCYGHSVFRLIQAQHYLDHTDVDLVILVQPALRWMVPRGVAQVWTIDVPWKEAWRWNDGLDEAIKRELGGHVPLYLCRPYVQPDTSGFEVQRFTGVKPFPLAEWSSRLDRPTITFIWRSDRSWRAFKTPFALLRYASSMLRRRRSHEHEKMSLSAWSPVAGPPLLNSPLKQWIKRVENRGLQRRQRDWIVRLAEKLRASIPNLDFGVAGLMTEGPSFPQWIQDFRKESHSDESAKKMCERYAQSHLVVGCNGSNLVLPGMHAGGVVNLVPKTWWAVSAGSFPFRMTEAPDIAFRYALVPGEISVVGLADILISILRDRELILLHTANQWRDYSASRPLTDWAAASRRALEVRTRLSGP